MSKFGSDKTFSVMCNVNLDVLTVNASHIFSWGPYIWSNTYKPQTDTLGQFLEDCLFWGLKIFAKKKSIAATKIVRDFTTILTYL